MIMSIALKITGPSSVPGSLSGKGSSRAASGGTLEKMPYALEFIKLCPTLLCYFVQDDSEAAHGSSSHGSHSSSARSEPYQGQGFPSRYALVSALARSNRQTARRSTGSA